LVDKNGKKLEITSKRDLRPDESLYRDRQTLIEKETELRKQKALKDRINVKELSNVEREKLIKEMEIKAKVLDYQKQLKVDEPKLRKKESSSDCHSRHHHKPEFLREVERKSYMESKNSLSERIHMNKNSNIKKEKL